MAFLYVVTMLFGFFCGCRGFCHRTESDLEVLKGESNSTSTYAPVQLSKDQLLVHHINTLTKIDVKIDKCELPTFYWLPKLHKRYKQSHVLYQIQVTALLHFFRSILHLI